jgi:RNA polymerase sigma-70 factor (ECF subfamily)
VRDDIRERMIELLPRLRRFSYALTGNLDKADDLVQETCARALASADQWQIGTRLDSWMYRIAQNIWFDRLRATKTRGEVVDVDAADDIVGVDGRDVTESLLTLRAVSGAIAELPADQQIVLLHVCIDGLSYKDTAEALGIPIGTVMSRLARARQTLHALISGGKGPKADDNSINEEMGLERNLR